MSVQLIGLIGICVLLVMIFVRVPVGIAMGLVGLLGYASIDGFGRAMRVLGQAPFDISSGYTLSVVPLFILMGDLALRSGMSAKLYGAAKAMFYGVPGAQAHATIGACAGFGAICGSSLATAATMTRIAVPEMRRSGYDDRLSVGSVAAGGSLGILIPPSIPFVIYGLTAEQSVPRLFAAGIVPGLLLMALYMLAALALVLIYPSWAPKDGERPTWAARLKTIFSIWDVAMLFGVSIGGLYVGWFTPTEAAAVGAFGALVLGYFFGDLTLQNIWQACVDSLKTTCMLFVIVIAAVVFSYFVTQTQLPLVMKQFTEYLNLGPIGVMVMLIIFYVILGCFMDGLGMILITVPVFLPLAVANGYDPIWFGVMLVVVIELGLIHPPVGMNIFVIQAQVPDIPVIKIYQGILGFLIPPIVLLILMIAFPQIVLWLPKLLVG